MSNLWINIRILRWHLQWQKWAMLPTIEHNEYHRGYPHGKFAIYEFFGYRS